VAILREGQAGQTTVEQLCRRHGIAQPTYYGWKRKYGSMAENEVRRLRDLEKENGRLKRLLAERDLELDVVKEFLQKSSGRRRPPRLRRVLTVAGGPGEPGLRAGEGEPPGLSYVSRKDDRALVEELKDLAAAQRRGGPTHRAREPVAERPERAVQREPSGRVPEPGDVPQPGPRPGADQAVRPALQRAAAPQQPGLPGPKEFAEKWEAGQRAGTFPGHDEVTVRPRTNTSELGHEWGLVRYT
jgi:putative transposase